MSFSFDSTITISLVFSILVFLFAWYRTRDDKLTARLKNGSDRMDRQEARINQLEQSVTTLPNKDDLHALQLEMVRQTGSLAEMSASFQGSVKIMERLEAIVSRHEDHLLERGKK